MDNHTFSYAIAKKKKKRNPKPLTKILIGEEEAETAREEAQN